MKSIRHIMNESINTNDIIITTFDDKTFTIKNLKKHIPEIDNKEIDFIIENLKLAHDIDRNIDVSDLYLYNNKSNNKKEQDWINYIRDVVVTGLKNDVRYNDFYSMSTYNPKNNNHVINFYKEMGDGQRLLIHIFDLNQKFEYILCNF